MAYRDFLHNLNIDTLDGTEWVGEVVDNKDPDFSGRCRIRVFGKFDGTVNLDDTNSAFSIPDEQLPWAYPASSSIFAGGESKGGGSLSVPKIGTKVKVKFSTGNLYAPEYFAIQDINQGLINSIKSSYENAHVLLFDEDENVKILYTKENGISIHLKDSHVTINPDTSITIEHSSSESIIELLGTTINIVSTKDVNITAQNCNIDSPNIKLGENAVESVIKGDSFKKIYDSHTHPAVGAPPTVSLPSGVLSKNTKTR